MMRVVMFAIIGIRIEAGIVYWLCYAGYSFGRLMKLLMDFAEWHKEWLAK